MKEGLKILLIGLAIEVAWVASWTLLTRCYGFSPEQATKVDTIRVVEIDTVFVEAPAAKDSATVGAVVARLPKANKQREESEDSGGSEFSVGDALQVTEQPDSADVVVPIERKEYTDSLNYRAVVSGYRAKLEEIEVYSRKETIIVKPKQKRFTVGLFAGYGITPRGMQPCGGVGVGVRIIEL